LGVLKTLKKGGKKRRPSVFRGTKPKKALKGGEKSRKRNVRKKGKKRTFETQKEKRLPTSNQRLKTVGFWNKLEREKERGKETAFKGKKNARSKKKQKRALAPPKGGYISLRKEENEGGEED